MRSIDQSMDIENDLNLNQHFEKLALLEARNYPFFYKIKRNLHIMDQLLNDENNS